MRRHAPGLAVLAVALVGAGGCVLPDRITDDRVLPDVEARFASFYPDAHDPDPAHDVGVLRPRFGIPAIARSGDAFAVEALERGGVFDETKMRAALVRPDLDDAAGARCLAGEPVDGCTRLALAPPSHEAIAGGGSRAHFTARPVGNAGTGGLDFVFASGVDAPVRLPRAVWLSAADPDARRTLRIVQLSDIHIGKHVDGLEAHLAQVVDAVNRLAPDAVVVTGDIVNWGQDPTLAPRAQHFLLGIDAPVITVIGNHDIGFGIAENIDNRYGDGWSNFARSFHPYLFFTLELGGWDLVGFDSGASDVSPRVLTRGLADATLAALRATLDATRAHGRLGAVLFSHAPSRAALTDGTPNLAAGFFGHMRNGNLAFEQLLLDEAAAGERVIHLAGHTHWSDVFVARPIRNGSVHQNGTLGFVRVPESQLVGADPVVRLDGPAALVTTQSATHPGLFLRQTARGWGFAVVTLPADGSAATVRFHRYGVESPPVSSR